MEVRSAISGTEKIELPPQPVRYSSQPPLDVPLWYICKSVNLMGLSFNIFKRRKEERKEGLKNECKEKVRKRNCVNAWVSKQFEKGNVYSALVHT